MYTHTPSMDYARTSLLAYNNKNIKHTHAFDYIHTLKELIFLHFFFILDLSIYNIRDIKYFSLTLSISCLMMRRYT